MQKKIKLVECINKFQQEHENCKEKIQIKYQRLFLQMSPSFIFYFITRNTKLSENVLMIYY